MGRLQGLALLAVLALALGACGGGKNSFDKDYRPINAQLLKLGGRIGTALGAASGRTNGQIERQFTSFGAELGSLRKRLDDLSPPGNLKRPAKQLSAAMARTRLDLLTIAAAARGGNATVARSATASLVRDSAGITAPRRELAAKTR